MYYMPYANINSQMPDIPVRWLAGLLEEQGVSCRKGKNGSIRAKTCQKAMSEMSVFKRCVYAMLCVMGKDPDRCVIDSIFFEPGSCFAPQRGAHRWPGLISHIWDRGYCARVYNTGQIPQACLVIVRKKRAGDTLCLPEEDNG